MSQELEDLQHLSENTIEIIKISLKYPQMMNMKSIRLADGSLKHVKSLK
jgi:hypothetical protein